MPSPIDRNELLRLRAEGAQLVEVLPLEEYEDQHLPGAIHMPLRQITSEGVKELDHSRPVIVYCWDTV